MNNAQQGPPNNYQQQPPPNQQGPPQGQQRQQGQQRKGNQQQRKTQQGPPKQQATQIAPPANIPELRIGGAFVPKIDENGDYLTISEFIETVNILDYEHYVGELNNKDKDEYWSVQGIDHFSSVLGIGVSELVVYDLGDVWLVLAHAICVVDGRPMCVAVTHAKSDRHSLEKACRRAGRNARGYLMPLDLFSAMLEEAKAERAEKNATFAAIKEASDNAGVVVREQRGNWGEICDGPTLVAFTEDQRGKSQSNWGVVDWNWLSENIANPESSFLADLEQYINASSESDDNESQQEQVVEEETDEVVDFEELAEGIEETE